MWKSKKLIHILKQLRYQLFIQMVQKIWKNSYNWSNIKASRASTNAFGTPIKTNPKNISTAVIVDNNICPCNQYPIFTPNLSQRSIMYFLYFRGVIPLMKLETPCGWTAKKKVKTKTKRKSSSPPKIKDIPPCMYFLVDFLQ